MYRVDDEENLLFSETRISEALGSDVTPLQPLQPMPKSPRSLSDIQSLVMIFVADGINSVGDYNSPPGGCRLSVCVCVCVSVSPLFFTFHDGITSKRFELLS